MVPVRVHTILISTQHSPDVSNETIHKVRQFFIFKEPNSRNQIQNSSILSAVCSAMLTCFSWLSLLSQELMEHVIKPVMPKLHAETLFDICLHFS